MLQELISLKPPGRSVHMYLSIPRKQPPKHAVIYHLFCSQFDSN